MQKTSMMFNEHKLCRINSAHECNDADTMKLYRGRRTVKTFRQGLQSLPRLASQPEGGDQET